MRRVKHLGSLWERPIKRYSRHYTLAVDILHRDETNLTKLSSNPSVDPVPPSLASKPHLNKSKPKEVSFDKSLHKEAVDDLTAPFKFDMLVQLANIPAGIIIYELLCLNKETRDALTEVLVDSESF